MGNIKLWFTDRLKGLFVQKFKLCHHLLIFMSFQIHMVTFFWGPKKKKFSRMFMLQFSIQWGNEDDMTNEENSQKSMIKVIFWSHTMFIQNVFLNSSALIFHWFSMQTCAKQTSLTIACVFCNFLETLHFSYCTSCKTVFFVIGL